MFRGGFSIPLLPIEILPCRPDFFTCLTANVAPLCFDASHVHRFGYYDNIDRTKAHGLDAVHPLVGKHARAA